MKRTILIALIALISCKKEQPVEAYYQNVRIGGGYWMTHNWDGEQYRNGDPIPQIIDSLQWISARYGAWKYYDNNPINGQRYGKLYNWYAVNDPRGFGPNGWHVPSDQEWENMVDSGGVNILTNGLGGYVGLSTNGIGRYGMWWSSNHIDTLMASIHRVNFDLSYEQYYVCKYNGLSVRLVKD